MTFDNTFFHIETLLFKDDGTQTEFNLTNITLPTAIDAQAANVTRVLNATDQIEYIKADLLFSSSGNSPEGTVTVAFIPDEDDEVEINGLTYTAKAIPTNPGDFAIGGTVIITATNLRDVINADTRIGTIGIVISENASSAIVTCASSVVAPEGNTVTLSTDNTNLTVSGATFTGGSSLTGDWDVIGRTITVEEDFTFSEFPNFFTDITNNAPIERVIPIPLENNDGKVKYLILWIQSAAGGSDDATLFFGSVETPENTTPVFPIFNDIFTPNPAHIIQRKVQQDTANRIYDYFIINDTG